MSGSSKTELLGLRGRHCHGGFECEGIKLLRLNAKQTWQPEDEVAMDDAQRLQPKVKSEQCLLLAVKVKQKYVINHSQLRAKSRPVLLPATSVATGELWERARCHL